MAKNIDDPAFPPLKPKVVLGVAAHPDDLEYWAGGSLACWASQGAILHFLVLTDGSRGEGVRHKSTQTLKAMRQAEQRRSAKVLGAETTFLDYKDSELEPNKNLRRDIVHCIRKIKPDVVVSIDPGLLYASRFGFVNHPDHRAAGQATLDAVYPFARNHLSFPEMIEEENLEPHVVSTVLLANFENFNFWIDISDFFDKKIEAWKIHKSQASTEAACGLLKKIAKDCGQANNVNYAEGFVRIDVMD